MSYNITDNPEIKTPKTKAQKVDDEALVFKVKKLLEKAVLPSRGSALAVGYDLS
ncbi:hypothetical protein Tco_0696187, partial [Tanacetum coccineum]